VQRGEIWWAALRSPRASEPGYRRPVLIIQADEFNASRIETVLAAIISSNLALADAPGNILVKATRSGLPRDSVVNVSQIVTINKSFLLERIGSLPGRQLAAVEQGLRLVLGL